MAEFVVDGNTYRSGKMDAITQFHVIRRLMPVVGSLRDLQSTRPAGSAPGDMADALMPMANAISKMTDADSLFVIGACLSLCVRQIPGQKGWVPIWNANAARPQFDDIELVQMIQIVGEVLGETFAPFLRGSDSSTSPAPSPS